MGYKLLLATAERLGTNNKIRKTCDWLNVSGGL